MIVLSALCVTALWMTMGHQKLVVVDMTRVIQEPALRLAHSKLSASAQNVLITRYTKLLPKVIEDYSALHQVTVISAKVLSSKNTLDITPVIINETIQRLKHAN